MRGVSVVEEVQGGRIMSILILYILIRLSAPWWTYLIWFIALSWKCTKMVAAFMGGTER